MVRTIEDARLNGSAQRKALAAELAWSSDREDMQLADFRLAANTYILDII